MHKSEICFSIPLFRYSLFRILQIPYRPRMISTYHPRKKWKENIINTAYYTKKALIREHN